MRTQPLVVGVTGNIGAGKSAVLGMLAAKGAHAVDMDAVTRRALHSSGPGHAPTVREFGEEILDPAGEIDRTRLGGIVFGNADRLQALEDILHPVVFEMARSEVAQAEAPLVAIEAIKLLEAGFTSRLCDEVWVVTAAQESQLQRLADERGMDAEEARRRMASQTSQEWKAARADRVIPNDGDLQELARRIDGLWQEVVGA